MRIAIVAPEGLPVPAQKGGSVQIYLTHLVQALAMRPQLKVYLLSPGPTKRAASSTSRDDGPSPTLARGVVHLRCPSSARANPSLYQSWVRQTLAAIEPEVIQVENRPAFMSRLQSSMTPPVILNLHSTTFLGPQHIQRTAVRPCLESAACVVFNSLYLRRTVRRSFQIRRKNWNTRVVYPAIEMADWSQVTEPSWNPDDPFSLLFIGRVIRQKGVHILIEAVRALCDAGVNVRLSIIGKAPPWEQAYRQQLVAASRRLPIAWLGFLPQSALPEQLAQAQALVVPSQGREAFGLVNLEALAAGVPVVASAVGGITEVVNESCGILVHDAASPEAFSLAIRSLVADPEYWRNLQRGTKKRAATFPWERTARRFDQLYHEIRR